MARKRQGKQKHTARKERNVWKKTQGGASYVTDERDFSERLSNILDHLVINKNIQQFRKRLVFTLERETSLANQTFGYNRRAYIFGSQIEGTTTIGLKSDTDYLHRFDTFRLFLDSENPPLLSHDHQVVIKMNTNGCASQYCILTLIEPSTQARRFQTLVSSRNSCDIVNFFRREWKTTNGMIPHTVMFDTLTYCPPILTEAKRHGPAESLRDEDYVYACYCKNLPKQCNFFFIRPRPGHWPSEKTLKKAKKYGVFIIPQGPPKNTNICTYDYFDYQWRISTNLTERLLMFSLDEVHLKAYVLTKSIRKDFFVPEYRDRLSTFHFKTAFFFAVENTRPDVWIEDNLINCVKYILATLRRFLTRRNCPHFTIENVNLFDGKIERHEFPKLVDKLTHVIYSLRKKIETIQMDIIRQTLYERSVRNNDRSRYCFRHSALFIYVFGICHCQHSAFYGIKLSTAPFNYRKAVLKTLFTNLQTCYRPPLGKYKKYENAVHRNLSAHTSRLASVYLEEKVEGREYNRDGINEVKQMFIQSLESDMIDNYMRYASFLFCNGEYDEACTYFDLIENMIQEDTKSNHVYQFLVSPSESLALQIAKQAFEQTSKQRTSVVLIFGRDEVMCVPVFLRCEMYRGRFGTCTPSDFWFDFNEDLICVQIQPYLYYLQYLTYRELHQEPKQSEALVKLSIFTEIIRSKRCISSINSCLLYCGYFDTSLNMLGHCLELEQKLESAWKTYKTSLHMKPHGNAAALHITRLLWQVVQGVRTEQDNQIYYRLLSQTFYFLAGRYQRKTAKAKSHASSLL